MTVPLARNMGDPSVDTPLSISVENVNQYRLFGQRKVILVIKFDKLYRCDRMTDCVLLLYPGSHVV